jgi:hypothetical protein
MNHDAFWEFFNKQISIMRSQIKSPPDINDPTDYEITKFQESLPIVISEMVKQNPPYNRFDMRLKNNIKLDMIPPARKDMEHDIFDGIVVDYYVPFVALNMNIVKVKNRNNKFHSTERRFKLHSPLGDEVLADQREKWSTKLRLNIPFTLSVKVWASLDQPDPSNDNSYIDFLYHFEDGWKIRMRPDQDDRDLTVGIKILNEHLVGFKIKEGVPLGISMTFPIDHYDVKHSLFRSVLTSPHNIGGQLVLYYFPFMWLHEAKNSQGMRKHLKVQFKMGDIQKKFIISTKFAKNNNLFYQNKIPYEFVGDRRYNKVSIHGLKSIEEATLVKTIITSVFFMYGKNYIPRVDVSTNSTYMITHAQSQSEIHSRFLGRTLNPPLGYGPSLKISYDHITKSCGKTNILNLKTVDPTFYRSIATGRTVSGTEHQPRFLVRSTDPNWQRIIANEIQQMINTRTMIQIIRYPFVVHNDSDIPDIVSIMPPYFLIGSPDLPYINIKPNAVPKGSNGTRHSYIISIFKTKSIIMPGDTIFQDIYNNLIDLDKPFVIQNVPKKSNNRCDSVKTTMTILSQNSHGYGGLTLSGLDSVLKYYWITHTPNIDRMSVDVLNNLMVFKRTGTGVSKNSILRAFILSGAVEQEIRIEYSQLTKESDRETWLNNYRHIIADSINWNKCRQELYDFTPQNAKEYFTNPNTEISYIYFKSVLEQYFNRFIICISYDKNDFKIEIPRHKFFYAADRYPENKQVIVLLRQASISPSSYEYIRAEYTAYNTNNLIEVPWSLPSMLALFEVSNKSIDSNFRTGYNRLNNQIFNASIAQETTAIPYIHYLFSKGINWQYLDAVGKLRGFVLNNLFIWCDPSAPGPINVMSDPINACKDNVITLLRPKTLQDTIYSLKNSFAATNNDLSDKLIISYSIEGGNSTKNDTENGSHKVTITPFEPIITGIWFRYPLFPSYRFYVPVIPSKMSPEKSIDNMTIENDIYFTVGSEDSIFKNHDYMERVANVMIQLWQNLYLYSSLDDPEYFTEMLCIYEPSYNSTIDFKSVNRGLPVPTTYNDDGYPDFHDILEKYVNHIPGLFVKTSKEHFTRYQMVVNSPKIRTCFLQQARALQSLKQNCFGEVGNRFQEIPGTYPKQIRWEIIAIKSGDKPRVSGILTKSMMKGIIKLETMFKEPRYLRHFYLYASDYSIRSISQTIFMSRDEMFEYRELREMEKSPSFIDHPDKLIDGVNHKNPIFYKTPNGNVYIIQHVVGNALLRAYMVVDVWISEKMNLGYYASEIEDKQQEASFVSQMNMGYYASEMEDKEKINFVTNTTFNSVDPELGGFLLLLRDREYAAVLKLNTRKYENL